MSIHESKTSWGRVAATLVASGCAAALVIAILLPKKSSEQNIAQLDDHFKKATDVRGVVVAGDIHPMDRAILQEKANSSVSGRYVTNPGENSGERRAQLQADLTRTKREDEFTITGAKTSSISGFDRNPLDNKTGEAGKSENKSTVSRYSASFTSPAGGGAISGPMPSDPLNSAAPTPGGAPRESLQPGDVVDTRTIRRDELALKRSQLFKNDPNNQPNNQPKIELPHIATPLAAIPNPAPAASSNDNWKQQLSEPVINAFGSQIPPEQVFLNEKNGESVERKWQGQQAQPSGEQYEQRVENIFTGVRAEPLSTFSIDVDTASYTNCRRFLQNGQLPPTAAVRVEEFINYFRYDYPQPTGKDPFSVNMEMADCPWTPGHKLLRVGLKGKEIDNKERPESNLVFLVDVSGSMSSEDKLPLLRDAMHRWVNELSANDRVTIVTYAGDAGLRLPTTRGDQKDKLHAAIETLQSGGSTHGSAGIKLAYEQATANFLEDGGVNRVLWATDGDLNVGTTGDEELVELITNKAKSGVFLTVLGVGTGNLKDAKLEKMADKGNGVYAYLDSPKEARKVLIEQMSGTTITIAKDVKIQIEFNPAEIAGYRLIGYENRILAAEDFANDKKDAGEIGAGHTVTALYEIIPVGTEQDPAYKGKEPLKYQDFQTTTGPQAVPDPKLNAAAKSGELLTLKLRFKQPDGHQSELREFPLKERGGKFTAASKDFQFAGCVAQLAMILRDSQYRGEMTTAAIAEIATATKGVDKDGSRAEFVELVKQVQQLGK